MNLNMYVRTFLLATTGLLILGRGPALSQHTNNDDQAGRDEHAAMSNQTEPAPVLRASGQALFGTVQEAIQELEADSTTDWSAADVDRLRQHLLDMHHVAVNVNVEQKTPIDGGIRIRVRPTRDAARASLDRVLDAHPRMLMRETGWTMAVDEVGGTYVLRVTTDTPEEIDKIRALGYMGLLAYGSHHQRHHWHLVRGGEPHEE